MLMPTQACYTSTGLVSMAIEMLSSNLRRVPQTRNSHRYNLSSSGDVPKMAQHLDMVFPPCQRANALFPRGTRSYAVPYPPKCK